MIVVCGAVVAFVGILQYLFHFDPTPLLRPPGMHFGSMDASTASRDGLTRAAGTTSNPLEFGVFCSMVLPLAIHVAFRATQGAAGRVLVDVRRADRGRSDVLGVAVGDPRRWRAAGIVLFFGWPARRRMWMVSRPSVSSW